MIQSLTRSHSGSVCDRLYLILEDKIFDRVAHLQLTQLLTQDDLVFVPIQCASVVAVRREDGDTVGRPRR